MRFVRSGVTRLALGPLLPLVVALSGWPSSAVADGIEAELEAGLAFSGRNDVRIPGDGGTRLSLVDDLSSDAAPVFRVRLGYRMFERHFVSLLYAPLSINATGRLDFDVAFAGERYVEGSPVLAVYRFDSYRLTYRYAFVQNDELELAAGVTGKIRDAEISFHGARTSRKTNTGFVPLLNLHAAWNPGGGQLGVVFDADALAAPQGRAEDILLAGSWAANEHVTLYAGYRMLEGGADNDEVYNFAWLHYAVLGARLRI